MASGECQSCGRPTLRGSLDAYCAACEPRIGRGSSGAVQPGPRDVLLGFSRRPADAGKLATAILTLRDYVIGQDDVAPEVQARPRYLTSSNNTGDSSK